MEVIVAPEPMDYEIRGMYRFATLREDSGLAEAVRGRWPENPRLLMIAAEPDNDTYTENLAMDLATALVKADLPVGELRVLQRETADVAAQLIAGADVIVLADGEGDDADADIFLPLLVGGPVLVLALGLFAALVLLFILLLFLVGQFGDDELLLVFQEGEGVLAVDQLRGEQGSDLVVEIVLHDLFVDLAHVVDVQHLDVLGAQQLPQ